MRQWLPLILVFALGIGTAWAAQQALVVSGSVTYDANTMKPLTQTTGGALRVSCS